MKRFTNERKSKGAIHKRRRQLGGGKGSKIGQNCRLIVLKNGRHREGGVKNPENLPTSFMDGPLAHRMTDNVAEAFMG